MLVIELFQYLPNQRHGVAQIGPVVRKEQPGVLIHHHDLHRGGAGVDADMDRSGIVRGKRHTGHCSLGVPGLEGRILFFAGKQRRLAAVRLRGSPLLQGVCHCLQIKCLIRVVGCTQGHKQQTVFRAGTLNAQRPVKALPQNPGEGQRSAQIEDIARNGPPLSQARDGLVHHRLIDAGGNILGLGALVNQGLNIALGKHAAAGSDGVRLFRLLRGGIHLVGAHLQKRGHLIDERAGTAGTGSVHPDLHAVGQKEDLGVLAAQLDDDVRPRSQPAGSHTGGEHLLNKRHAHTVGHAHARRTGNCQFGLAAGDVLLGHPAQQLLRLFQNMAEMPFICTVNDVACIVQHHTFDGGGTDIKSDLQCKCLLWENGYAAYFDR